MSRLCPAPQPAPERMKGRAACPLLQEPPLPQSPQHPHTARMQATAIRCQAGPAQAVKATPAQRVVAAVPRILAGGLAAVMLSAGAANAATVKLVRERGDMAWVPPAGRLAGAFRPLTLPPPVPRPAGRRLRWVGAARACGGRGPVVMAGPAPPAPCRGSPPAQLGPDGGLQLPSGRRARQPARQPVPEAGGYLLQPSGPPRPPSPRRRAGVRARQHHHRQGRVRVLREQRRLPPQHCVRRGRHPRECRRRLVRAALPACIQLALDRQRQQGQRQQPAAARASSRARQQQQRVGACTAGGGERARAATAAARMPGRAQPRAMLQPCRQRRSAGRPAATQTQTQHAPARWLARRRLTRRRPPLPRHLNCRRPA